ncbi:MAG: hypothetical protein BWY35_02008 [Firmicutes bacterium ADurb.Bin248]|nr:MAG: hypothetical protein BWY35_02008 [Firmicutes bacterium ADurb.Bin248]HOG00993.1 hypothetical protein [Clostridia bacterium]
MKGFVYKESDVYIQNAGILRRYCDTQYKLIHMRVLRRSGFIQIGESKRTAKGSAGNFDKLRESLSRSRKTVYELAICNEWSYFVTLTINAEKCERYDLNIYMKALSKWLNNLKCRKATNVQYLLIPEPHKNDAWHMHGLMNGIPSDQLEAFSIRDNIPERIKSLIRQGRPIYNWRPYYERFGWVTVEAIRNKERCAAYITKYITKDLLKSRIALNHHVYYSSLGLRRSEIIQYGELERGFEPDYKNDYVRVKYFDNAEEPLSYFRGKED